MHTHTHKVFECFNRDRLFLERGGFLYSMKGEIWVGYVSKLCKKNMTHFSRDRFPGGIFVGIFEGRHGHEVVFLLSIVQMILLVNGVLFTLFSRWFSGGVLGCPRNLVNG